MMDIKQIILSLLERKRREGDVLPFVTSIELAEHMKVSVREAEEAAKDVEIAKGRTEEYEYYYE